MFENILIDYRRHAGQSGRSLRETQPHDGAGEDQDNVVDEHRGRGLSSLGVKYFEDLEKKIFCLITTVSWPAWACSMTVMTEAMVARLVWRAVTAAS